MKILPVILASLVGFLFCVFRRKEYEISIRTMIFLLIIFTLVGDLGSHLGALLAENLLTGRRLYGLMIVDTILVLTIGFFSKNVGKIGDFVSIPVVVSCCGAKINCLIKGCCYGFVMYYDSSGNVVRFPSQIFEILIWIALVIWLLVLEKKGRAQSLLWPISIIWFGLIRYLVDFFRGSPSEKIPYFFSMPGGRFWSLVLLIIGLVYMYFALMKKKGYKPSFGEYCKALIGN